MNVLTICGNMKKYNHSNQWSTLANRYADEVRQYLDASVLAMRRGKSELARALKVRGLTNWKQLLHEA
jgi:hypothetical protein